LQEAGIGIGPVSDGLTVDKSGGSLWVRAEVYLSRSRTVVPAHRREALLIRLSLDAGSPRVFETGWGLEYGEIATSGISVRGRSSFSVAVPDKPKFGSTNEIEGNEPAAACAKNRKAAEVGEYPAIREGPKKLPQGTIPAPGQRHCEPSSCGPRKGYCGCASSFLPDDRVKRWRK